jgi:excisionase family DNA binding protein
MSRGNWQNLPTNSPRLDNLWYYNIIMNKNDRDLLSTREAAERAGLSQDAITKRIQRGQIPAEKVGGIWLIPFDVVKGLIRRRPGRKRRDRGQGQG